MDCTFCLVGAFAQVPRVKHTPATEGELCKRCADFIARNNEQAKASENTAIVFARIEKKECPTHGLAWHSSRLCIPCVVRLEDE